ncbi:MAG: hypothetical protein ACN0LA_13865 [Candidatus Longimicrobiales bacterium M2_2A_002]
MTTRNHRSRAPFAIALLALVAFVATSCIEGDDPIIVEPDAGPLFERYVSLGNSITAGFQSGGIVEATQEEAYPVLLAAKAGARFGIPALAAPGCPPLFVAPLSTVRTDPTVACALRTYARPDPIQNMAVPGANTAHVSDPIGTGTTLNTLILGGRTQLSAMADADPSLISVWIGNNDALTAALSGTAAALTPTATFQSEYDQIVTAMLDTDAQDAILIGAANPMVVAPALQPGAYFWALPDTLVLAPTDTIFLDVSNDCAPFDGTGAPNPLASRLISFVGVANALGAGERPLTISCVNGVEIGGAYQPDYLLDETEIAAISTRIAEFNGYIEQQAGDNGWIYIDPTSIIGPALANPNAIRKCQGLATATDPASFAAAVQNTCPGPSAPNFFGSYFSFDGVHPSSEAHGVIADSLAGRLNAVHGLSLPID